MCQIVEISSGTDAITRQHSHVGEAALEEDLGIDVVGSQPDGREAVEVEGGEGGKTGALVLVGTGIMEISPTPMYSQIWFIAIGSPERGEKGKSVGEGVEMDMLQLRETNGVIVNVIQMIGQKIPVDGRSIGVMLQPELRPRSCLDESECCGTKDVPVGPSSKGVTGQRTPHVGRNPGSKGNRFQQRGQINIRLPVLGHWTTIRLVLRSNDGWNEQPSTKPAGQLCSTQQSQQLIAHPFVRQDDEIASQRRGPVVSLFRHMEDILVKV